MQQSSARPCAPLEEDTKGVFACRVGATGQVQLAGIWAQNNPLGPTEL